MRAELVAETVSILVGYLEDRSEPAQAVAWADRLTAEGVENSDVIELALTSPSDWQSVRRLIPAALEGAGVPTEQQSAVIWIRERLIDRLQDSTQNLLEVAGDAYRIGSRLEFPPELHVFALLESELMAIEDGIISRPADGDLRSWAVEYARSN